jgi:hypothetical protein
MSGKPIRWMAVASMLCAAIPTGPSLAEDGDLINDYPTIDRADYVYGCMQVNGNTRLALERCSCSIDVIAASIPYEVYQHASTIKSLSQRGGESVAQFANPASNKIVHELKLAQIEGELRCF